MTRPNRNRQSHPSYRHSTFTMRSNVGSCAPSMPSTMSSRTATPSLGKPCRRFSRGRMLSVLTLASPCPLLIGGIFRCYLGGNRKKGFRLPHCFELNASWFFLTPAFFFPLHAEILSHFTCFLTFSGCQFWVQGLYCGCCHVVGVPSSSLLILMHLLPVFRIFAPALCR